MKTSTLIKRFSPYFKPYKHILFFDLFCAGLTSACDIVLPLLVRSLAQKGIDDISNLTIEFILKLAGIYLLLRIIDVAATYFMANIGHIMGAKIETDMRSALFAHLQKLSFRYYSDTKVGQLMARITSDLFDVTEFAHHCPEEFFIAGLKISISFIILCTINIPLTLIIFLIIPFMVYFCAKFNHKMKTTFRKNRVQVGEINAQVEDSLLGIRVVKSFTGEQIEIDKFKKGNENWLNIKKENYNIMGAFTATNRAFDGLLYLSVIVMGGFFMINRLITPADFMAYILYIATLMATIRKIIEFAEQFQRGLTGIDRFFEIMDVEPDVDDNKDAIDVEKLKGEIKLENVSFAYADDPNTYVLKDVNIDIHSGQNIALVGPSGGGKSTICNLIPRFYDVTSGKVTIDGIDVRKMKQKDLRKQIGMVQQDVYLFSGTIYENILYGKPNATKEEVIDAAKKAGAHEFIIKTPNGYDTFVGERGIKLSGGQKQRISIARVFLKNPPILILDEATSALDNESEKLVQESLGRLSKGRTVITIAHRLSTVRSADMIFVLTENGISENGTHKELITKNGVYANLYELAKGF